MTDIVQADREVLKAIYAPAAHEAIDAGDYDSHQDAQAIARHRSEAVEELVEVLAGMLPTNVCLTNTNVPDHWAVPLETTMGELRKIAALVAKHRGEQG